MKIGTIYDQEIISFISDNNFLNKVIIEKDVDNVIEQIEDNFIMGYNGIDWEQNLIIFSKRMSPLPEEYIKESRFFLEKINKSYPNLLEEIIYIIGDNLTDLSYKMSFHCFLLFFDKFLLIPQHTYIWFIKSKKCINFTFENEVFFG